MSDERITCESCGKKCTPRLRHTRNDEIFKKHEIDHLCPYCGTVMYRTGGELTLLGKGMYYALCGLFALWVIQTVF